MGATSKVNSPCIMHLPTASYILSHKTAQIDAPLPQDPSKPVEGGTCQKAGGGNVLVNERTDDTIPEAPGNPGTSVWVAGSVCTSFGGLAKGQKVQN